MCEPRRDRRRERASRPVDRRTGDARGAELDARPVGREQQIDRVSDAVSALDEDGACAAGTMCANENCCVDGVFIVTIVVAGVVDTIVSTIALVTRVMFSWHTRHSAAPRLRIRQLSFGR